jgi:hypothetical protein
MLYQIDQVPILATHLFLPPEWDFWVPHPFRVSCGMGGIEQCQHQINCAAALGVCYRVTRIEREDYLSL